MENVEVNVTRNSCGHMLLLGLSVKQSCLIIIIIIIQFLYSANSRMADRCAAQEKY